MTTEVPAQAVEMVCGFEGFSSKPYLCPAGRWTIGFGSTRDSYGRPVDSHTPYVTKAQAMALMKVTLQGVADFVADHVTVPLTDPQLAALVSFTYNAGEGSFVGSTLLKKLNKGDYSGAAAEFDKWTKGGGKVLPGLVTRRATERRLFESSTPAANDVDAPDEAAA